MLVLCNLLFLFVNDDVVHLAPQCVADFGESHKLWPLCKSSLYIGDGLIRNASFSDDVTNRHPPCSYELPQVSFRQFVPYASSLFVGLIGLLDGGRHRLLSSVRHLCFHVYEPTIRWLVIVIDVNAVNRTFKWFCVVVVAIEQRPCLELTEVVFPLAADANPTCTV